MYRELESGPQLARPAVRPHHPALRTGVLSSCRQARPRRPELDPRALLRLLGGGRHPAGLPGARETEHRQPRCGRCRLPGRVTESQPCLACVPVLEYTVWSSRRRARRAHGGRERRRALPHPPSRTGVTATQTRGGWGAPRARTARDAAWNDTCTPAHHTALPGKNDSGEEGSQRGASTGEAKGGRRCSAPRGKGASHLGVCRASPHSQEQPLSPDWQGEEGRGPRLSPPRQVPVPQEKGSKFFY